MAIKRTKNKEEMPDFDEIMTEVEQEVESQKTEQEITNHLSELKELYGKLDEATRALTTANQELQSALHIYQQVEKNLCSKIDSINQHVDNVLDTAPDRLNVEIKIIDSDLLTLQTMFKAQRNWFAEQTRKNMHEISDILATERRDAQKRFKEYDGCYLGHHAQWFFWFFFTIGIFGFASMIILLVIQAFR